MVLRNNRLDLFHQRPKGKLYIGKEGFNWKISYFDPCVSIMIIRQSPRMLSLVFISNLKKLIFPNKTIPLFQQDLNEKHPTCGEHLDWIKINLGPFFGTFRGKRETVNNDWYRYWNPFSWVNTDLLSSINISSKKPHF